MLDDMIFDVPAPKDYPPCECGDPRCIGHAWRVDES